MVNQRLDFFTAFLALVFAQDRDEGLRKSAFCEQATQIVGNFEGHKKSISPGAGTEKVGYDHVTYQSEDTGDHGHQTDHQSRFKEKLAQTVNLINPGVYRKYVSACLLKYFKFAENSIFTAQD
jgi:hypothetical protein